MGQLTDMGIDAAELEAQARMPPQYLVDMRKVYAGDPPETAFQMALKKLMDENLNQFLSQLRTGEKEWRAQVAALGPQSGAGGKVEEALEDAGTEAALKMCEEWLKAKAAEIE